MSRYVSIEQWSRQEAFSPLATLRNKLSPYIFLPVTFRSIIFENRVYYYHDTLPLAKQAWPSLGTYKLATLAQHVGAAVPTHRALVDAKALLAVLLAARQSIASDQ